jgi:hypothetical protein
VVNAACPLHGDGYRAPKRAGGATLTEARRAELGRVRLHVRIAAASLERLDELCADSGFTRPEQIEALIDCEHDLGAQKPSAPKRARKVVK